MTLLNRAFQKTLVSIPQVRQLAKLGYYQALKSADRLIETDYPVRPKVRHGWDKPRHSQLDKIIGARRDHYAATLRQVLSLREKLTAIQRTTAAPGEPTWLNAWFSGFDALSLYGLLVLRNPRRYIEIGSGDSTKFARRAIRDYNLRTKIVSIDPFPRSEIDALCDQVIRAPLEDADLEIFANVGPEDTVFCDNSHRSFQNSDVTVFFTEALPRIGNGTLIGIHDIFLPFDYPAEWAPRFYNEQYLLACYLLGGNALTTELPVFFCQNDSSLQNILTPIREFLADAYTRGSAFWVTKSR